MATMQDFLNVLASVKSAATQSLANAVSNLQARAQANAIPDQVVADLQEVQIAINQAANQLNNTLSE